MAGFPEILVPFNNLVLEIYGQIPNMKSVAQVRLVQAINSYYVVNFPSVALVPHVAPINSYHFFIFLKLMSFAWVPLVQPIKTNI